MSAKADAWMPLYIADYLADTVHLTTEQHGAYLLLLMTCWKRGGSLPACDVQLAAITRLPPRSWKASREVILAFFRSDGDAYTHKRLSAELEKARAITEKRREAGLQGGRPKKQTESTEKANGFANGKQTGLQTETPSPSPREERDANASLVVGKPIDDPQLAFDQWNELAGRLGLPKAKILDKGRRAAIRGRLADGGLEAWALALKAVERSRHCRGENDRGWRADLDFVCQPRSWRRLLEGSYGDDAPTVGADAPLVDFRGPADLRQAVAALKGEAWTASWLDACEWDEENHALVPRTNFAAAKLRSEVGSVLAGLEVRIEERAVA